ncbi:uncharacterized protein LOC103970920 [Musa acuminata AAA Group]|uniref:uncharacterized protein LOC103970920 n=1 Tax=Musa acuminata AAA Group TaxID=214697 RepID=UPI0031DFD54B
MNQQDLDCVLVPAGLTIMLAYHLWLLRRIAKHPTKTVSLFLSLKCIPVHADVGIMIQNSTKNGVLAIQTLRNNIMASTLLATTAFMLCSVIVYLMTNSGGNGSSSKHSGQDLVLGDRSKLGLSVELFSILVCFVLALLLNIEAVRYYSHVSILINVPLRGRRSPAHLDTAEYVAKAMNKGSYFWSGGLHPFDLSLPFFLWISGPISMVIRCLLLVCFLYRGGEREWWWWR